MIHETTAAWELTDENGNSEVGYRPCCLDMSAIKIVEVCVTDDFLGQAQVVFMDGNFRILKDKYSQFMKVYRAYKKQGA